MIFFSFFLPPLALSSSGSGGSVEPSSKSMTTATLSARHGGPSSPVFFFEISTFIKTGLEEELSKFLQKKFLSLIQIFLDQ